MKGLKRAQSVSVVLSLLVLWWNQLSAHVSWGLLVVELCTMQGGDFFFWDFVNTGVSQKLENPTKTMCKIYAIGLSGFYAKSTLLASKA